MNKQNIGYRVLGIALVLVVGALAPACGGGGSSGPGGGGNPLVATFLANDDTPGANTMNLAPDPGGSSGASFAVRVQVTTTDDFFGAGFRITFDPASAEFLDASSFGSFLTDNGDPVHIEALSVQGAPGEVKVIATIQDVDNNPPGIDVAGTQTLITLNFRATDVIDPMTPNSLDFKNVEVQTCPTRDGACTMGVPTLSGGKLSATR